MNKATKKVEEMARRDHSRPPTADEYMRRASERYFELTGRKLRTGTAEEFVASMKEEGLTC